ncbi:glycosyltransferase family 2 protein [Mucilaginibacter sp. HMF5004]|uniref:glycosyltransferase n=1 Tax=Mucilaginibacter rivuli TaxID=2857527 RepID=UPI001C5F19A1|nr:glycosyltransferase family 2 protein [Mucilaginibacter rivuli]MBW4889881.1 glycosyltransferase family 2 protein [Mucilaginibacter rivuli]
MLEFIICIPTYNAGARWKAVLENINNQNAKPLKTIIIDSGSIDDTVHLAIEYGFKVISIDKSEFNHGKTRQQLANFAADADICIFLTQDAILSTRDSIRNIVIAFDDPEVGMAYGRQLPRENAEPLEIHARLFNYPPVSDVRSFKDKDRLGFKVFFCSNSFSAYRKSALNTVDGFPSNSIMGEDAIVAAKMLLKGFRIAYVAEATAYHSHNYTLKEEFERYFDTRVFHEQNNWLIKEYGKPTGEGLKFVKSEIRYAFRYHKMSLFKSVGSIFAKWLGYNIAKHYKKMPINILKRLSMHKFYWKHQI